MYRFSNRGGGGHEQEVTVPLGSPALDECPDLATPQAQVNDRVQALLPVKNDAIHMLPIQHQLCSNQVDLQEEKSIQACLPDLLPCEMPMSAFMQTAQRMHSKK